MRPLYCAVYRPSLVLRVLRHAHPARPYSLGRVACALLQSPVLQMLKEAASFAWPHAEVRERVPPGVRKEALVLVDGAPVAPRAFEVYHAAAPCAPAPAAPAGR